MKTILAFITIACLSLNVQANNNVQAQLNNCIKLPSNTLVDLNIQSIRSDIYNRTIGYYMTGSFTVIKEPYVNAGVIASTVDISFRNSTVLAPTGKGKNYIQVNAQATRNDNNSINEVRVYIHQDNGNQGKIDVRNIKINWKTGAIEVVHKLANVSVIYQENSILIVGTMQKNGYTMGVTLAIAKRKGILGKITSEG